MRWERFFDDLEDQLASEWEAERAALDSEAERLRLARVSLRDRLIALGGRDRRARPPVFAFADGETIAAEVAGVGADWVALEALAGSGGLLAARLEAIVSVDLDQGDLLRSARPHPSGPRMGERITFGFAVRDLVRRRAPVVIHLVSGRVVNGTIDRAGADHLDIALHDPGTPRRPSEVTGQCIIGFAAVARVHTLSELPVP